MGKLNTKEVIRLRSEGYTYDMIAEEMGVNKGTISKFYTENPHLRVTLPPKPRFAEITPEEFAPFSEAKANLGEQWAATPGRIGQKQIDEDRARWLAENGVERMGVDGVHKVETEKIKFSQATTPLNQGETYGKPNNIQLSNGDIVPEAPGILTDRLNTMHMLPPGAGRLITKPFQNYAGVYRAGQNFYLPADQALQASIENSRAMFQNLVIRESVQSRIWASSQQEWHVEPKDKHDPVQLQIAKDIENTIRDIPYFLKLKYALLKSRWFGTYAVNVVYNWNANRKLFVKEWVEIMGDSLQFKMDSNDFGVYVTYGTGGMTGANKVTTEPGYRGPVHVYSSEEMKFDEKGQAYIPVGTNERDAIILMRYDSQAADFLDSRNAGGIVGLGLRSVIYPSWYNMQEMIGNMQDWMERVGSGITIFKFLRNNQSSYEQALVLAESQSNQAAVMCPVDPDLNGGKPMEGIERIEPSAVGLDNFLKVIVEFFESQIRRFIVGQDSTSQPVNAGLGSKIAEVHESTFGRIVTFDCQDLEQTLTDQLVRVIQKWNHPGTEHCPCRFVIDYAKPDIKGQIEAAKLLYDMGIELDADEVRSLAGFKKPQPGAVLAKQETPEPQMPGMPGNLPPGQKDGNEGEEVEEEVDNEEQNEEPKEENGDK